MLQNHLLQLLCLVAMEPPTYVDRETVRDEKLKVLQALKPITADDVERCTVAGQYGPGLVDGERRRRIPGRRREPRQHHRDVRRDQGRGQNWRWAGVPFYLRTGKRMSNGAAPRS